MTYHTTVLLHEGVDALAVKPGGVYIDATFGGGGHSKLILKNLGDGKLFGFDQDPDSFQNVPNDDRFVLCKANFRFIKNFMLAYGVTEVDGVLADLGVSGYQFDEANRGFSFRFDAPLDMRMNQAQELNAAQVVNQYSESELKRIFHSYGESSFGGALARRIVMAREEEPISTIDDLVKLIGKLVPERKRKAELAKIFQAIRIEVNDEMGALKEFLVSAGSLLKSGGRLVVISYHSLEDRPVKHYLRAGNFEDKQTKDLYGNVQRILNPVGKVMQPSNEEIERNPRARSAKMRIAEKI